MKLNSDIVKRLQQICSEIFSSPEEFESIMCEPPMQIEDIYQGRVDELSNTAVLILKSGYHINPEWLKTGKGSKYLEGRRLFDPGESLFFYMYRNLPPQEKEMVQKLLHDLLQEQNNKKKNAPAKDNKEDGNTANK